MTETDDVRPGEALDREPPLSRLLQQVCQAGLFVQDHATGEHLWSPNLRELLGLADDVVMSAEVFLRLVHPEDHAQVLESGGRAHADLGCSRYEVGFRMDRAGEWRHMRATVQIERDELGRVARERGVLRDVTEQRSLDQQLRSLDRRGALGRVAAGIAHDFNNLLSAILGEASLQLMRPLAADQAAAFESIVDISERAASLTSQLLLFTRSQPTQLRALELNDMVRGLGRLLARVASERCEVRFELTDAPLTVRVDRLGLEQVIINLVVNARDALARGGTIRLVSALEQRAGRAWATLRVIDDGEGMSPEVLGRAQQEFFTTKPAGTGLGLAISRQIISDLDGELDIASVVGVGTEVSLRLPVVPEFVRAGAPRPASQDGWTGLIGARVLVVDDEPLLVELAVRALRGFGCDAHGSSQREQALRWLDQRPGPVAVVVTDVVMPGMSLAEFMAAIRAREPEVAFVAMSGYTPDEAIEAVGRCVFVAKPFTPVTLAQAVLTALSEADQGPADRGPAERG